MRAYPFILSVAALAVAGGTAAYAGRDDHHGYQAELAKALSGTVRGKTLECVDPQEVEGPEIVGKRTLVYRRVGTLYRNDLIGPCPSLESDSTIIMEVKSGELCRNDMFRTVEPGDTIPSQFCRLGNFTEYDPVKH